MTGEPLQRPALSQRVGLSKLAVSELLASLEKLGMVKVEGQLGGAPGRSQLSYALQADAALVLGFDIGGTKVAGAIADLRGEVLAELTEPTAQTGATDLIAQLARMADALCRTASIPRFRLRTAAVGVPAAVHPLTADLSLAGNLPGLEGGNLLAGLQDALRVDILIDNDVNLALLAEVGQDGAPDRQNAAFIALGTGIGGALMINGQLLRGAHGGAGEVGYMPLWRIDAPGIPSLEEQVGETGIRHAYVAAGGDPTHTVRDIFTAAEAGSASALWVLDQAAEHVARAVLALLALLDPDLVVFGGSIGARPEFIQRVSSLVASTWLRPVSIVRSRSGSRAGLLGALKLARGQLLDDLFGALPSR
ncbi:ROK family protein [Devosia sp. SL43]|uniref:ROK family protein n=1 Tax=Devosia sp. SL43 TaxID=2806348 RepID=UPI001F3D6598|nr:ROK family protein [Devosia sp. SL43]UJW84782.1 ROK family protein [Devosia sp. SL43]